MSTPKPTQAGRLPWFRTYAAEELEALAGLGAPAAGVVYLLKLRQWRDGSLPEAPEAMARAVRVPPGQFRTAWARLDHLFPVLAPGCRANPELAEQREIAMAKTQQAKDAARTRWDKYRQDNNPIDADALRPQSVRNADKTKTKTQDLGPKTNDLGPMTHDQGQGPTASWEDTRHGYQRAALKAALSAGFTVDDDFLDALERAAAEHELVKQHGHGLLRKAAASFVRQESKRPTDQTHFATPRKFLENLGLYLWNVSPGSGSADLEGQGVPAPYGPDGDMTPEAAAYLGLAPKPAMRVPDSISDRNVKAAEAAMRDGPPTPFGIQRILAGILSREEEERRTTAADSRGAEVAAFKMADGRILFLEGPDKGQTVPPVRSPNDA